MAAATATSSLSEETRNGNGFSFIASSSVQEGRRAGPAAGSKASARKIDKAPIEGVGVGREADDKRAKDTRELSASRSARETKSNNSVRLQECLTH